MIKKVKIEKLKISEWTTDPEIYSLMIRTENRTKYIEINNGILVVPLKEWTIEEAIKYFTSTEGQKEMFSSWWAAYTE